MLHNLKLSLFCRLFVVFWSFYVLFCHCQFVFDLWIRIPESCFVLSCIIDNQTTSSFLCIQARINLSKYVKREKTLRIGKKNFYCNFINIQNIIPATVEYESVCIKYSTWKNSLFFVTIMMVFVIPINRSSFESLNVNTFLQNQLFLSSTCHMWNIYH